MSAKYLVYDIETIPESEIAEAWRTSGDYEKDKKYQHCEEGEEPFAPHAAHRVITIGAMVLDHNLHVRHSGVLAGGCVGNNERGQIVKWNEVAANNGSPLTIVDWNGKKFDEPVLQYRAFRYGLQMPWYFGLLPDQKGGISKWSKSYRDRYGGQHVDLVELWNNHGVFKKCHLKELAQLMGLPGKVGIDGSKVHGAWQEGRHGEIDRYCVQDVWHTGFIMMRMHLLMGKITAVQYLVAAELLITHITGQEGHESFLEGVDEDRLLLKA